MKIGGMIGLVQVSRSSFLEDNAVFRSIKAARTVYRLILAEVGAFFVEKSVRLKSPGTWNSADQREFRDLLMTLEGAERALGLSDDEANEGRRALELPERGKILAVM